MYEMLQTNEVEEECFNLKLNERFTCQKTYHYLRIWENYLIKDIKINPTETRPKKPVKQYTNLHTHHLAASKKNLQN